MMTTFLQKIKSRDAESLTRWARVKPAFAMPARAVLPSDSKIVRVAEIKLESLTFRGLYAVQFV